MPVLTGAAVWFAANAIGVCWAVPADGAGGRTAMIASTTALCAKRQAPGFIFILSVSVASCPALR